MILLYMYMNYEATGTINKEDHQKKFKVCFSEDKHLKKRYIC